MIPEIRSGQVPASRFTAPPSVGAASACASASPVDRLDVRPAGASDAAAAPSAHLNRRLVAGLALTVGGAVASSLAPVTGAVVASGGLLLAAAAALQKVEPRIRQAVDGVIGGFVENAEAESEANALGRDDLPEDQRREVLMKQHLRNMVRMLGESSTAVAGNAYGLADFYQEHNRLPEAIPLYERGLAILERSLDPTQGHAQTDRLVAAALGKDYKDLPTTYRKTAQAFATFSRLPQAERLHQRAVEEREQRGDKLLLADELDHQAAFYRDQGRAVEALPVMERAAVIRAAHLGGAHPTLSAVHDDLGRVARQAGQDHVADRHEQMAAAIHGYNAAKARHGDESPVLAPQLEEIAHLHAVGGTDPSRHEVAADLRHRADMLGLLQKVKNPPYPGLARDLVALASWYRKDGHETVAFRMEQRARSLGAS